MFYALTSQEATELKNRSIANGWNLLPVQGANNRAFYRWNNGKLQLKSYETIVFEYDTETGEYLRTWGGYSATTLKHVQMFVCFIENKPYWKNTTFGKANWDAMEVC